MTRAEDDLARAVVVTVIGSTPLAPANAVAAAIATRMDVEAALLVLRRASSSSYLLFLPNVESVDRLVSLPQPLRSPDFSLLCKRWSRLAGATGQTLPYLVDIELCGIPTHVWETSTVEQLLSPHGLIDHVHSDTLELVDLSTFRCSIWCSDLSSIPRSKELWVMEPPSPIVEDPPVKRVLAYPIDIQASVLILPDAPPPSGDSSGDDSGEDGSSRQRRRSSAPSLPPSAPGSVGGRDTGRDGLRRTPAQESGGPSASNASHKAAAVSVVPKVLGATSQVPIDDVRELQSNSRQYDTSQAIRNEVVEVVNSLEILNGRSPSAFNGAEHDMQAPSVSSPILASFVIEAESNLVSNGLEELGQGVASNLQGVLGCVGATESPASQRSPLCFPTVEATVFPASPRIPTPPHVLEHNPKAKTPTTLLRVYSRHRFRSRQQQPSSRRRGTSPPPLALRNLEGLTSCLPRMW